MGNRRVILLLLACICTCALLLWAAQRRARQFSPAGQSQATLLSPRLLESLDRVLIERGDLRVELRRLAGLWDMYAPFPARVDQGEVARFLDAFECARISDAISLQELRRRELSLRELGLSPAVASVAFYGPQWQTILRVGSPTPLGDEVYVRADAPDQVFVVSAAVSAALPRNVDDLRSKKVVNADRASIRSIEVREPGRPFIKLSKDGGTWRLVQPVAAPASDERVEVLLDTLFAMRAAQFVWPTLSSVMNATDSDASVKSRLEVYGLTAEAGLQVSLLESGGAAPVRVVFGRGLDNADALRYALLQGGDTIVAVSNSHVRAFNLKPLDIRDTRLFFEKPGSVRRLEVRLRDLLFVLAQTNGVWRMQAPVEYSADQRAVCDTVEQMLRLNAEVVTENGADAQNPASEVDAPISYVDVATDSSAYRLTITPEGMAGDRYRVVFTNSPAVFHVASSNVPCALVSMSGLLGLHDKTVLALSPDTVRRVTVKRQGESSAGVAVQRDADAAVWHLGDGATGQVMPEKLAAWLACVAVLKADRIEKLGVSPDDLDAYGLRNAWLEFSVDVDVADALRMSVLVGKEAGHGKRYAMVRARDVVFVLDAETLRTLSMRFVEPL